MRPASELTSIMGMLAMQKKFERLSRLTYELRVCIQEGYANCQLINIMGPLLGCYQLPNDVLITMG